MQTRLWRLAIAGILVIALALVAAVLLKPDLLGSTVAVEEETEIVVYKSPT